MPKFSQASLDKLSTCDERLQILFNKVIEYFDCTIVYGNRGEKDQNEAFAKGASKKKFPDSKHNSSPSKAVDAVPYPINWGDEDRMYYFSGVVMGIAKMLDIEIRWGGDWDKDTEVRDQTFNDLGHFQLED